jgi:predicted permease
MEVLDLVLPIFAVMVTGVIVGHTKILPEGTADILIKFVFYIAIPALLFMVIGQEKASSLFNPPFLAVLGGGFIAAYAILAWGDLLARLETGGSHHAGGKLCRLELGLCRTADFACLPGP